MYKALIDDSNREINMSRYGTDRQLPRITANTGIVNPDELGFPIVALGASIGGQAAFQRFLLSLPPDCNLALVLVPHFHPEFDTLSPELFAKYTQMPISLAKEGMEIKSGRVYLIPPGKIIYLEKSSFHLAKLSEFPCENFAIDYFFKSLAVDQGARAIAGILSGNGNDGCSGATAVKARLGLTLAQDPQTTEYTGMTESFISTNLADYIAPPEQMPERIINYIQTAKRNYPKIYSSLLENDWGLRETLTLLYQRTGLDFRAYKKELIFSRLQRRMNVHDIADLSEYAQYLKHEPEENWRLFKELLIDVPIFFRNAVGFLNFKEALKKYLAAKPEGSQILGWIAGCAGGEETYSIAMTVHEAMDELKKQFEFHLYATDIEVDSVNFARNGIYPASIGPEIGGEILEKYFIQEGNLFRVKDKLKNEITFLVHNLLGDFPFSKVDFISCRNLFNYFREETQESIIPAFHYALQKDGLLFLGITDSIQSHTELFRPLSKKWRIYCRKEIAKKRKITLRLPIIPSVYRTALSP